MLSLLALAAVVLLGSQVRAGECPFAPEAVERALAAAPTCKAAANLLSACAVVAGGDVGSGAIVQARCERDFLAGLRSAGRRIYVRKLKQCERKYAHETGTMYRSFEAFCRVGVAQQYSARALRTQRRKKADRS